MKNHGPKKVFWKCCLSNYPIVLNDVICCCCCCDHNIRLKMKLFLFFLFLKYFIHTENHVWIWIKKKKKLNDVAFVFEIAHQSRECHARFYMCFFVVVIIISILYSIIIYAQDVSIANWNDFRRDEFVYSVFYFLSSVIWFDVKMIHLPKLHSLIFANKH